MSRTPFKNLNPIKYSRSVLRAIFLGLILASVIPLICYYILKGVDGYEDYAVGLVFIAAAPFAASVGPLSLILRGDLEHALRSTIIVYVVALAWIPFIVWLTLGETVDMLNVITTVAEIIGIPLTLSLRPFQDLRKSDLLALVIAIIWIPVITWLTMQGDTELVPAFATALFFVVIPFVISRVFCRVELNKTVMAVVLNTIIAFLVWLSVSSATLYDEKLGYVGLVVFMLVAFIRDFGLGSATEVVEKKMKISWSQRVTDILMVSYKNKGIAIALCVSVLVGPAIGKAMLAIAASIAIEVIWVAFMDSVLFSKKRMARELSEDRSEGIKQTWE